MKKSLLEIYALAVCFATVVCFVISLGIGIYDLVQITNPEFTLSSYEFKRYQTNDAFWNKCPSWEKRDKERTRPPEDELTKQRKESFQRALQAEQRDAFQSFTQVAIIIFISAIVFLIHWRIAKRAREMVETT